MQKLATAVIGAGHLGRIHTKLIREIDEVTLVGVADPDATARETCQEQFGVRTESDYRRLIDRIDMAVVAAPTSAHFEICSNLLEAGVHVLVEKPITLNADEGAALVALAEKNELILQVGHVERFNPAWTAGKDYLHNALWLDAARLGPYSFRSTDVGVVFDLMIHDIDLALSSVAGSEVVSVEASGRAVIGPHEDIAEARLEFASGATATLRASRIAAVPHRQFSFSGARGEVYIDFGGPSTTIVERGEIVESGLDPNTLSFDERAELKDSLFSNVLPKKELAPERRNAILDEQREFVQCVLYGGAPRCDGRAGVAAVKVAQQVIAAIHAGQQQARKAA